MELYEKSSFVIGKLDDANVYDDQYISAKNDAAKNVRT